MDQDWNWNPKKEQWECRTCTVNGRPEPEKPIMKTNDFNSWSQDIYSNWELARTELDVARESPGKSIVGQAKLKRAEDQYNKYDRLAEIATYIDRMRGNGNDIYIKIPELELEVRFK